MLSWESIERAFDPPYLTGDWGADGVVKPAWRPLTGKLGESKVHTLIDGGVIGVLPRGAGSRDNLWHFGAIAAEHVR